MKLVQEIYEKVMTGSGYMKETAEAVEDEINRCMNVLEKRIPEEEKENIRDMMYGAAHTAEKKAFEAGFAYAAALLLCSQYGSIIEWE